MPSISDTHLGILVDKWRTSLFLAQFLVFDWLIYCFAEMRQKLPEKTIVSSAIQRFYNSGLFLCVRLHMNKHIWYLHSPSLPHWHAADVLSTNHMRTHAYTQYKQKCVTHTNTHVKTRPKGWNKFQRPSGRFAYCCCNSCSYRLSLTHVQIEMK